MNWIHEQGYRFTGEASFYRLTIRELRILYEGYELSEQLESDANRGISRGERSAFESFEDDVQSGEFAQRPTYGVE